MFDIVVRLVSAQVGSCNCMTKTPDPAYHKEDCRYRVMHDAMRTLLHERALLRQAMERINKSAPENQYLLAQCEGVFRGQAPASHQTHGQAAGDDIAPQQGEG